MIVQRYKGKLVYAATDDETTHYVADAQWYAYMTMRPCAPQKVIIFGTQRELKKALEVKGVFL